jgi:hypothetical protein
MAKRLEHFDPAEDALPTGRPPEYPWHLWLNGETWQIKQGTDFHCKIDSMISLIRHTAASYDLKVSIYRQEDDVTLIIKTRTEDGEEKKQT